MLPVRCLTFFFTLMLFAITSSDSFAEDTPLGISEDGRVVVDSILNLKPSSAPPENPSEGDLYFTDTKDLLLFSNGKWNKIALLAHNWESGNWSNCSANCGGGSQTRSVACKRSDGVIVAESYCSGDKPMTSQPCNTQACKVCRYAWRNTYWETTEDTNGLIKWDGSLIAHKLGSATSYSKNGYLYTRTIEKGEEEGECQDEGICEVIKFYEICREPI